MPEIAQMKSCECTGCGACQNICPKDCIYFEYDNEGFLYPHIGKECVECGLCAKTCPILAKKTERIPEIKQYAVAAVSNDRSICEASTSGGAFTEICKAYGDEETVVFGVRFDGLNVVHSHVIGVEKIAPFRKSKYVQSDMGNCLAEAKAFLNEGRKVVFSGTPCQIAGLRCYLGKEYENLLCIDFICHGVGSPKVFDLALRHIGEKEGSEITKYTFRNQVVRLGNRRDFISCHEFADGRKVYDAADIYQSLFLSQLCLRASCGENCKFRNQNRVSDITIADFKGKWKVFPMLMDNRQYSTIVVNSSKGDSVFQKLKGNMKILPCEMSDVERFNPLFFRTTKANPERDRFFRMFCEGSNFEDLESKFLQPNKNRTEYEWMDYLMPFHLRRIFRICIDPFWPRCISFKQKVLGGLHHVSQIFKGNK